MRRATRRTGILWSPEGAATLAATRGLRATGWLRADDPIQAERDAALVATAVQALDAVGGGRAVGYGRVAVALRSLHLGGVERDVAELLGRALPGGVA